MILFILPLFSGGGAERVALNLLAELHNRGHLVGIIVFDKNGPLLSMVPNNVQIYNLNTGSLKNSVVPLVRKIRQLSPKVVFSTFGYINVALLAIGWLLPAKTKIWVREANLPSISLNNNRYPKLTPLLYRLLYRYADKVICTSKIMKNEFVSDFSVPEGSIEILPNPVDIDFIRSSMLPIRRFDNGGICYIASGRLTFQKGFDRLLKWFSILDDKRSTLTILGDGNLKNELMRETELLNLQKRVRFVGFCDNPWQWYAGADVFLLPSRWEGMPNSVLEVLACGTSVIATEESGGIKEIVEKSKNNSIIVAINPQQFIHYMKKVKIKNRAFRSNSLLPEKYRKENVISIVERWINELK